MSLAVVSWAARREPLALQELGEAKTSDLCVQLMAAWSGELCKDRNWGTSLPSPFLHRSGVLGSVKLKTPPVLMNFLGVRERGAQRERE